MGQINIEKDKQSSMLGHFGDLAEELSKRAKEADSRTRKKVGREYEDVVTARG